MFTFIEFIAFSPTHLNPYNILNQHLKWHPLFLLTYLTILFGPLKVLSVSLELVSSLFFSSGLFKSSPTHFHFLCQTSQSTIFLLLSRSFFPFKFTFLYKHCVSPICLVYLDVAPSVSHISFLLFIILSILTLKFMMYKMNML